MKRVLFFLPLLLIADDSWLASIQQKELQIERERAVVEAKKLRDSWINPIQMSYRYQEGNQFPNQLLKTFTITLEQPLFKSGGIWAAILYADATKIANVKSVDKKRRQLVFQAIALATQYKILDLQIKKQQLALKNAYLDIKIKREQYLHGELDSTFLDNAIMKKNSAKLQVINLEDQKREVARNFAKISDTNIDNLKLPNFQLIKKEYYLSHNYDLTIAQASIQASKYNRWMQVARYLPTVSVFGSYNYQSMQGSLYVPGYRYSDYFYTYGFAVSMPLFDINSLKNIEIAKLDYLKNRVGYAITQRDKEMEFAKVEDKLQKLQERMALADEDIALYKDLVKKTKDLVKAGEKTTYDLEILQNSYKIRLLDKEIYQLQKQQILQNIYKEMHP
ncbi:TolC family protein [Nitratiruptor sp. YY09-18]|uniref:TolC family protein n=1 Tax=Nitratiruptor sp. YY09-18 TaxID=2724901 RepID=UPI0019150E23|nr:TolC family protein [Nitratiruptor sp. YY09-18]BCD68268.1 hypothetical protein NitYY0918_C1179 [Nitratiruptor sp. YY09-18]